MSQLEDQLREALGQDRPRPASPDLAGQVMSRVTARRRRRRAAGVTLSVACLAGVVLGVTAATGPDGERAADPPPAASDPYDGLVVTTDDPNYDEFIDSGSPLWLLADGRILLKPGLTVIQHLDNPFDAELPARSIAVLARDGDQELWLTAEYNRRGDGTSWAAPEDMRKYGTFRAWVAELVGNRGTAGPDDGMPAPSAATRTLARPRADGTLDLAPGYRLVRRIDDPPGYDQGGMVIGVELEHDGEQYFGLMLPTLRNGQYAGGGEMFTPAAETPATTLEEFLADGRDGVFEPRQAPPPAAGR